MSDQEQVDPKKTAALTQQLVSILANVDSETRRRAVKAAFAVLGEDSGPPVPRPEPNGESNGDQADIDGFFARDEQLKPSDNAFLCAAYHYSQHGDTSFALEDLRKIASEAGVEIPDRLDVTLKGAAKAGKKMFQCSGKGQFKTTATARVFFRDHWQVRAGRKTKVAMGTSDG